MRNIFLFAVLIFLLMGCGLSSQEQYESAFYATQYAKDPNNIPPPKYQTLAATALGYRFDLATPSPTMDPHWTPTMSGMEWAATQAMGLQQSGLTSQAQQQAFEMDKLAAEQRAQNAQRTAEAAQVTAQAYAMQQTAEARALAVQYTAQAQGTAMMATAQWEATATRGAQMVNDANTATAYAATAYVQPTHAIYTQHAVDAAETITAGEAKKVQLAAERQRMKNVFDAYGPWAMVVSATIVAAVAFSRFVQTRAHVRDEHGSRPLLEMRARNGDRVILNPDIIETAMVKVTRDGDVVRYAPVDANEQSNITRRSQAIEAIRALPIPYANTAGKIMTNEFGRNGPRVTINPNGSMGPALDEAERILMEDPGNG